MRQFIIQCYEEALALSQAPEELKDAIRRRGGHGERVPAFLDNLNKELNTVQNITKEQIRDSVYSLTDLFINTVKRKADEDMMSDAAKSAIVEKSGKKDELADRLNSGQAVDLEEVLDMG